MRTILYILATIVVLAAGLALVAPAFIDWTAQRDRVARLAADWTGWAVAIDGELDVELLPQPRLTVTGLRVAGALPDGTLLEVDVAAAEVTSDLFSLLGGSVWLDRVIAAEPRVRVIPIAEAAVPSFPRTLWSAISIERLVLQNGRIEIVGERNRTVSGIDLRGSLAAPDGPLLLEGVVTAAVAEMPLAADLSLRLSRPSAAGALPAAVDIGIGGGTFRFNGRIGGGQVLRGRVSADTDNLAIVSANFGLPLPDPAALEVAASFQGDLTLSVAGAELDNVSGNIAGDAISGAVSVAGGERWRVRLNLDADRLPAAYFGLPDPADFLAGLTGEMPAALERLLPDLAEDVGIEADINIAAIPARGRLVREVHVDAALSEGLLRVRRLAAQLPGGSNLAAAGMIRAASSTAFDARVELVSNDLRSLLDWSGVPTDGIPAARLRRFGGSLSMAGRPGAFQVSSLDVELDSTRLTGTMAYSRGARAGLGLRFAVDRLDLDSYGVGDPADTRAAIGEIGALTDLINANLDLDIGALTLGGEIWRDLVADVTVQNGGLAIRTLSVGHVAGTQLSISGRIDDIHALEDLHLEGSLVSVPDPGQFLALVGVSLPVPPLSLGQTVLSGRIDGSLADATVALEAEVAGGALSAAGQLRLADAIGFDGGVTLSHPDLPGLLRRLVLPVSLPRGFGPVDLAADIQVGGSQVTVHEGRLAVGPIVVDGGVIFDHQGDRPSVTAAIHAGSINVAELVGRAARWPFSADGSWSAAPIDIGLLDGIDGVVGIHADSIRWGVLDLADPSLVIGLDAGNLDVDLTAPTLFDGRLRLAASLDAGPRRNLELDIALTGADATIALPTLFGADDVGGRAGILLDVDGAGRSAAEIVDTLSGRAYVSVEGASIDGLDLSLVEAALDSAPDPVGLIDAVRAATETGRTELGHIAASGTVAQGVISTDRWLIDAPGGQGVGHGLFDLAAWSVDLTSDFSFAGHDDAPPLGLEIEGSPRAPVLRLRAEPLQAYVAARAAEDLSDRFNAGESTN